METNPSKMDMETADLSPVKRLQNFIETSKKKLELLKNDGVRSIDDCDDDYDYLEFAENNNNKVYSTERAKQYNLCLNRMAPLFARQPRLKKNVTQYPKSQIMPIINAHCPNLEELNLAFKEAESQDFENVFSYMVNLTKLRIEWQCKNLNIPGSLVQSMEEIDETLESLELICNLQANDIFSPDLLASIFPRLDALKYLFIDNFYLSELLLKSIGEIKNLTDLRLMITRPENHPMCNTNINLYPIGNLKSLEKLFIFFDHGVRDEFLINLCNNAKKLRDLQIVGTSITDYGLTAMNNLQQLKSLNFDLIGCHSRLGNNEFITDQSIKDLRNRQLDSLCLSNCPNITVEAAINLVKNLPNLQVLNVKNTKITDNGVLKLHKLAQRRKKSLQILA